MECSPTGFGREVIFVGAEALALEEQKRWCLNLIDILCVTSAVLCASAVKEPAKTNNRRGAENRRGNAETK
jgi:hypothetical protein